jgi:hypothetical protein
VKELEEGTPDAVMAQTGTEKKKKIFCVGVRTSSIRCITLWTTNWREKMKMENFGVGVISYCVLHLYSSAVLKFVSRVAQSV